MYTLIAWWIVSVTLIYEAGLRHSLFWVSRRSRKSIVSYVFRETPNPGYDMLGPWKKLFSTWVYELKDYSVIRLPLHQPRKVKLVSNCLRWIFPRLEETYWIGTPFCSNLTWHSKQGPTRTHWETCAFEGRGQRWTSKTHHWELNSWCRVLQRGHWLSLKALWSTALNTPSPHPCHSWCSLTEGWQ